MDYLHKMIENPLLSLPQVDITDIIEIIILSVLFYQALKWVKYTKVWALFNGLMVLLLFGFIAANLHLDTITWILSKSLGVGVIALIIIFQPELRKALELLGRKNVFNNLFMSNRHIKEEQGITEKSVNDIVKAAFEMSKTQTGALMVIERDIYLGECERTGILLDAILSSQLLINIFEHNTPLHDGAVIIRGNRIICATSYLPLSHNMDIEKKYGTRHRAALGISEQSDSITVIVSEETGYVSLAQEQELFVNLTQQELKEKLLVLIEDKENMIFLEKWRGFVDERKTAKR